MLLEIFFLYVYLSLIFEVYLKRFIFVHQIFLVVDE